MKAADEFHFFRDKIGQISKMFVQEESEKEIANLLGKLEMIAHHNYKYFSEIERNYERTEK